MAALVRGQSAKRLAARGFATAKPGGTSTPEAWSGAHGADAMANRERAAEAAWFNAADAELVKKLKARKDAQQHDKIAHELRELKALFATHVPAGVSDGDTEALMDWKHDAPLEAFCAKYGLQAPARKALEKWKRHD